MFSKNPGLTLEVFAQSINQYMNGILYSDLLVSMGLTYSTADPSDFYSECWQCVEVIEGDYRGVITWLSNSTTSSIS